MRAAAPRGIALASIRRAAAGGAGEYSVTELRKNNRAWQMGGGVGSKAVFLEQGRVFP